jgi:hypothetical protein
MPDPVSVVRAALAPVLKPRTRLVIGLIAIPALRTVRKRVPRLSEWDAELEKDVEQWFRGSLLLLVSTKNAEIALMTWAAPLLGHGHADAIADVDLSRWWITAGRLLLAIGVVEAMPDQHLFSVIHPGPSFQYKRENSLWSNCRQQVWPLLRGFVCQHLNRSSPLFAILAVFYGGTVGWFFYALAIVQYLIIGLVTSRDRAFDVLSKFDRAVELQRKEILREFHLPEGRTATESGLERRPG